MLPFSVAGDPSFNTPANPRSVSLSSPDVTASLTTRGLRHTHATMLLEAGINPKVVSERLGHTSVATTMDIYSHVLPDMQEKAALAIDEALGPK